MYLIGLDFGTTNLKALLFQPNGQIIKQAVAATPLHYNEQRFAEFYADEIYDRVLSLIKKLLHGFSRKRDIKAISFGSMAETGCALDRRFRPLSPAIAWFDQRTIGIAKEIAERIDAYELYMLTGMQLSHVPSVCKILWEKEYLPEVYRRLHRWVFLGNYLAYRLSGELYTDPSIASRSMAFDIHRGQWSRDICSKLDIDTMIFPPVTDAGQTIGTLRRPVAQQLGLQPSVIIALGGHDHLCGALSIGLKRRAMLVNSSGTVDVAITLIEPANIGRELFGLGVGCGPFLLPGYYYAGGGIQGAGRAVQWFAERFFPELERRSESRFKAMNEEVARIPVGSEGVLFIPHLRGSIVPHRMPASRGCFLGLREYHGIAQMARAVYEGLAMEYRLIVDRLEEQIDTPFSDICCFGGGTQNREWIEIKAHVLNRPLLVYETRENTALGAAILAGVSCGLYNDIDDALDQIVQQGRVIEPNTENAGHYELLYQTVYRPMFRHLSGINQLIEKYISSAGVETSSSD